MTMLENIHELLPPLKTLSLHSFKRQLKSHLIIQLTNNLHTLSGHLATARTSDSYLMLDYVRVTNFALVLLVVVVL